MISAWKRLASNARLSLPVAGSRRFGGGTAIDVTGNAVAVKNSEALALFDEAILSMITLDSDPTVPLNSLIDIDDQSGLANGMLAFELLRRPRLSSGQNGDSDLKKILKCLKSLEHSFETGSLSKRETYIGAAAAAYCAGNYTKAGALLENSLVYSKQDALALRLAQDSYIAGGNSSNVLGCVARWLHAFDERHILHGHVMGMLASGFLENGRFSEAEEAATRAVSRTGGRDVWALHTLLNTYLLMGRSSEVKALLEDHQPKHDGIGLQYLVFNKGLALIQRGNYSGALRVHDDMVDNLLADPTNLTIEALLDATLLLWLVSLNSLTSATAARWQDSSANNTVAAAWRMSGLLNMNHPGDTTSSQLLHPLVHISATMALAGMAYNAHAPPMITPLNSEGGGGDSTGVDKDKSSSPLVNSLQSSSRSMLNWIRGGGTAAVAATGAATVPEVVETTDGGTRIVQEEVLKETLTKIEFKSPEDYEKELEDFVHGIFQRSNTANAYSSTLEALQHTCPKLLSIKPSFNFSAAARDSSTSTGASTPSSSPEKHQILKEYVAPISNGIASFGSQDFNGAALVLSGHRADLNRVGGTCIQRDIIAQTIIDSFLNSEDRHTEARLLLCERTTLTPNDSQAWRRLAPLFARIGMHEQSATASYTAWQLGIGQGGFGGPK